LPILPLRLRRSAVSRPIVSMFDHRSAPVPLEPYCYWQTLERTALRSGRSPVRGQPIMYRLQDRRDIVPAIDHSTATARAARNRRTVWQALSHQVVTIRMLRETTVRETRLPRHSHRFKNLPNSAAFGEIQESTLSCQHGCNGCRAHRSDRARKSGSAPTVRRQRYYRLWLELLASVESLNAKPNAKLCHVTMSSEKEPILCGETFPYDGDILLPVVCC